MQRHDLVAANTLFAPGHSKTVHTYLHTTRQGESDSDSEIQGDCGEYVGREVHAKYRGKLVKGKVEAVYEKQGERRWVIRFRDNYVTHYSRAQLEKKS